MNIDGWKYYNHAVIPTCAPHESPDLNPVKNGSIWKIDGGIKVLATWITEWDCRTETNWWYVIKDTPLDINSLKSKRRYEINKGSKNFDVRKINPVDLKNDLYDVTVAAYSSWPQKYRPIVDFDTFVRGVEDWKADVFGAFYTDSKKLQGYAIVYKYDSYAEFSVLRVNPEFEKCAINAAIVAGILREYQENLKDGYYICDGSRSIRHETAFQDYLEKYFGFRKAYCRLNVKYRPLFGLGVKFIYPFRGLIKGTTGIGNKMSGILRMEEICRAECSKTKL